MTRSKTVRSGASPLYVNYGASCSGDKKLGNRYFKHYRGFVPYEAMKRHCIKIDVFIDPCAGSGCFLAKHIDIISPLPGSRRQHLGLIPLYWHLETMGKEHPEDGAYIDKVGIILSTVSRLRETA